jgi:glycosyltransferase involved in cell wall biosynthesis
MRFAILGTRGIPANYGGFETFAEELSRRLVERGHDVTVYCRSHHVNRKLTEYRGVRLTVLPTIRHKYLDTVVHTFLSAVHAATRRFDAVLICNAANSVFIPILTWTGTPTSVNVDGLERKRKKWNWLGRTYYRLSERASVWFATEIITDARAIQEYYNAEYGRRSEMIAYGAEIERVENNEAVTKYGLQTDRYFLYVSRLEPENNAAMVIEAFKNVTTDLKLAIVGDAPYASDYKKALRKLAEGDERIVFTGFVFGSDYKALQQNAYAYVHATEVGGTHPALIEAMGYGNLVLCLSTKENREVLNDAGIFFENAEELSALLQQAADGSVDVDGYRRRAVERASANYSWESVTDDYEKLLRRISRSGEK